MPNSEDYRIANHALARLGVGRITDFTGTSTIAEILNDQYEEWKKELLQDHPWNFATRRQKPGHFFFSASEINTGTNVLQPTDGHTFFVGEGPFQWTTTGTLPTGVALETDYWFFPITTGGDIVVSTSEDVSDALTFSDQGTGSHVLVKTPLSEWSYAHYLPADCLRVTQLEDRDETYEWKVEQRYIYHNVGSTIVITYVFDIPMSQVTFPMFKRALALKIAIDLVESGVKTSSVLNEIRDDYLVALQRAKSIDGQEGSPLLTPTGTWADEMGRIS